MNESERLQAEGIQREKDRCFQEYRIDSNNANATEYNSTSGYCPPIFDEILCWDPTPINSTAIRACPHFIAGFLKEFNASKICTEIGQWLYHPGYKKIWTNYTQCFTNNDPTVMLPIDSSNITLPAHPKVAKDSNFSSTVSSEQYAMILELEKHYIGIINGISKTGYTISFCALFIALVIMLSIRKLHCPRNKLHMHLFASFILKIFFTILKEFLFVDGVGLRENIRNKNGYVYFFNNRQTNNWTCKLITTLWEFFIIANHSWILMEGLYLHNLIFRALFADTNRNILRYIILGWLLPLPVIVPWIITRLIYDDTYCWTTHTQQFIFLIIRIPIMISVLINFVLFIRITIVIYSKLQAPIYEEARRYQKWAKSTLVLVPLFGIHYAVFMGMSYAIDGNPIVELVWLGCDQFFASFQGLFVAILYCFLNAEVRAELKPHVHSVLTGWATHEYLKFLFPCKSKYLRSGRGRPSVCTTMSCSSLYNNGIGAHRNSRTKWEIVPKTKHGSAHDRSQDHVCRPNVRSWHEIPSRWLSNGDGISKSAQVDISSNGNISDEKSIHLIVNYEKSKSAPHIISETSCMLPENTKI